VADIVAEAAATVVASRVAVPAAVAEVAAGAEPLHRKPLTTQQQNGKSFHMRSVIESERNATRKESKADRSVPFPR
jgi:hypothetical protein